MFNFEETSQFKKDIKRIKKRSQNDFKLVADFLMNELAHKGSKLHSKYKPHILKGKYVGDWEAHIKPDLLIIWFEIENQTITLIRLGTHSDLF